MFRKNRQTFALVSKKRMSCIYVLSNVGQNLSMPTLPCTELSCPSSALLSAPGSEWNQAGGSIGDAQDQGRQRQGKNTKEVERLEKERGKDERKKKKKKRLRKKMKR